MIVFREREFNIALEQMMVALVSTATDGNGLKIHLPLDAVKFGAAILRAAGDLSYGESVPPYLLPDGESFPVKAFHPGDLTDFFVQANRASNGER